MIQHPADHSARRSWRSQQRPLQSASSQLMLYALLYVRGVIGMDHPTCSIGRVAPRGTTNQFIPGHDDRKFAPVGWNILPPAECLNSI